MALAGKRVTRNRCWDGLALIPEEELPLAS